MKNRLLLTTCCFLILNGFLKAQQPGDLDPAFSGDGKSTWDVGSNANEIWAMAVFPNNRTMAVGTSQLTNKVFAVSKFTSSGSPDVAFSGDGHITTNFVTGYDAEARAVVIQSDGNILVG